MKLTAAWSVHKRRGGNRLGSMVIPEDAGDKCDDNRLYGRRPVAAAAKGEAASRVRQG